MTDASFVIEKCRSAQVTVGTCESLTGGGIAQELTSVPGASDVFLGGLVTYSPELKISLAHVPTDVIRDHGVVSEPVAEAMAVGARDALGVDICVSVTGVAGPGSSDGVSAGTVCFGLADAHGVLSQTHRFVGDRSQVRHETVQKAINLVKQKICSQVEE